MILSFKEQFVDPILEDRKIHTIREDLYNRWRKGMTIHFATGVRTKNYNCFTRAVCTGIDTIKIRVEAEFPKISLITYKIWVNEKLLGTNTMERLASNDGLTMPAFMRWFNKDFDGKIIYWTRNHNIY